MTIGLLLAEPWSMTITQPAVAAASNSAQTSLMSSAPYLARAAMAMPAPDPEPAEYYALIDLGKLGDFRPDLQPGPDVPPNPDTQGTMGINNLGEVVYARNVDGVLHGFVWLPNDNYGLDCGIHDLNEIADIASSVHTIARDINDDGLIVGQIGVDDIQADGTSAGSDGIVWDLNDQPGGYVAYHLLPRFNSGAQNEGGWVAPHAINNDTDPLIVGSAEKETPCACNLDPPNDDFDHIIAFRIRWSDVATGGLTPMDRSEVGSGTGDPVLSYEASHCEARDVNTGAANSDVVGRSFCDFPGGGTPESSGPCTPVIDGLCVHNTRGNGWPNGDDEPEILKALSDDPLCEGSARGINDARNAVGFGRLSANPFPIHALIWDEPLENVDPVVIGERMPDGQDDPLNASRAEAINNMSLPQVVGWNVDADFAVRWNLVDAEAEPAEDGWEALDLSTAIRASDGDWQIREAHDINDAGWIVGIGVNLDPEIEGRRAVVLLPICSLDGDANGDGIVNVQDLLLVISNWGTDCTPDVGPVDCPGDVNSDGVVNVLDLLMVIANWGSMCDFGFDLECITDVEFIPPDPFQDVLDAWEFADWDEAAQWMKTADPQDLQDFFDDLAEAGSGGGGGPGGEPGPGN